VDENVAEEGFLPFEVGDFFGVRSVVVKTLKISERGKKESRTHKKERRNVPEPVITVAHICREISACEGPRLRVISFQ
jgi:hypothetical protein